MLKRAYDQTLSLAGHRYALAWLSLVSFVESSVFPIPPDVLLVPMVLARRERAFYYAGICTLTSVIGGFLGYAVGYFLFETMGRWLLDLYHLQSQFEVFRDTFNRYGAWIVLAKGMTPIPYKLITITAGVTRLDLVTFALASVVSRGVRFYLIAALLWWYGEPIRRFIERRLGLVLLVSLLLLVGGFLILKVF
ncbi:MAG: YqaA family protein [Alphaproteobacteria bacterium]